jgi:DNA-binding transcriptional ArsR family regulator
MVPKTTLLRQLEACRGGTYLPLDDSTLRAAAQADPDVFVADEAKPMTVGRKLATGPERNQSTSLRRALAVLDHVRAHSGLTLTQLAEAVGLSKSTVLRLTAPLVEARLLERDRRSGVFRLGHGTLQLGQAYLAGLDLRAVAAEESRQLMSEVRETVHLVVYDPPHVVYIDKWRTRRTSAWPRASAAAARSTARPWARPSSPGSRTT